MRYHKSVQEAQNETKQLRQQQETNAEILKQKDLEINSLKTANEIYNQHLEKMIPTLDKILHYIQTGKAPPEPVVRVKPTSSQFKKPLPKQQIEGGDDQIVLLSTSAEPAKKKSNVSSSTNTLKRIRETTEDDSPPKFPNTSNKSRKTEMQSSVSINNKMVNSKPQPPTPMVESARKGSLENLFFRKV